MSDDTSDEMKKGWRNTPRHTQGIKKGQFMKRPTKKPVKRLSKNTNERPSNHFLSGREIMEPTVLAKEMWCNDCKIPLSFQFTTGKVHRGLATIYRIKCNKCFKVKTVNTSELFENKHNLFAVNATAAKGILEADICKTQFDSLLSVMNIAPVSHSLLKRYERLIGHKVEGDSEEHCSHSLKNQENICQIVDVNAIKSSNQSSKDDTSIEEKVKSDVPELCTQNVKDEMIIEIKVEPDTDEIYSQNSEDKRINQETVEPGAVKSCHQGLENIEFVDVKVEPGTELDSYSESLNDKGIVQQTLEADVVEPRSQSSRDHRVIGQTVKVDAVKLSNQSVKPKKNSEKTVETNTVKSCGWNFADDISLTRNISDIVYK